MVPIIAGEEIARYPNLSKLYAGLMSVARRLLSLGYQIKIGRAKLPSLSKNSKEI